MKFERRLDIKKALGLGIKEELGYNITGITDEDLLLPGVNSDDIYKIIHTGSGSTVGFCSGKKVMKVLLSLTKEGFSDYKHKWIWEPHQHSGGSLLFYYGSGDEKNWIGANNTKGYNFVQMGEGSIMEL